MNKLLTHSIQIRPRFNEVDSMGYVYHANYITYFHQARTELLRTLGLHDKRLEEHGVLLPIIEAQAKYKIPVGYDENITVTAQIKELPKTRLTCWFEVRNEQLKIVCSGHTTVVFVNVESRKPMRVPAFFCKALTEGEPEIQG
jgi:acyl-CoA thioester hydrolase